MTISISDLTALFSRHDPEKLIAAGAPWNEYENEASAAFLALHYAESEAECLDVLDRVWGRMFGTHRVADRAQLATVAAEIWRSIHGGRVTEMDAEDEEGRE